MSKSKLEQIRNWPLPSTKKQLISFLGLCNYDSRFIKKFSENTAVLYQMTRKDTEINWTNEAKRCFDTLIDAFANEVCLAIPNAKDPFVIYTDASSSALSGVLLQNDQPVEFCSRILKDSEKKYSAIQRECLAIIFTIRKFRHYLLGRPFSLFTDHKPLTWLKQQRQDGMLGRWAVELQEFDFRIFHVKGEDNILADSVSRQFVNAIHIEPMISDQNLIEFQKEDNIISFIRD